MWSGFQSGAAVSALALAIISLRAPAFAQTVATQSEAPALTGSELRIENPEWDRYPVIGGTRPVDPDATPREVMNFDCLIQPNGDLRSCRLEDGTSASAYLVDFALGGVRFGKLSPETVARAAPDAHVVFTLRFPPNTRIESTVPPDRPQTLVTNPSWARTPRVAVPEAARARGLMKSVVGVSCAIGRDGTPHQCRILYEEHPGYGFGAAAIEALAIARVADRSVDRTARDARLLLWLPIGDVR